MAADSKQVSLFIATEKLGSRLTQTSGSGLIFDYNDRYFVLSMCISVRVYADASVFLSCVWARHGMYG